MDLTAHLKRYLWGPDTGPTADLAVWRERILTSLLAGGLALAPVALIPAMAMLVSHGRYAMAVIDLAGFIIGVVLLVQRRIPYPIRAGVTLLVAYGIGVGVTMAVSPLSGGPAWLFCAAILAGVLLGTRGAAAAIGLNALTLGILGLFIFSGRMPYAHLFQSPAQAVVAGVNFLFLNAVAALSVAVLLRGLEIAVTRATAASESLVRETAARLRMSENLAESEMRLQIIFDHAAVGIAETTLTGAMMRVNRRFCQLMGFSQGELQSMTVADISHPDEYALEVQRVRRTVETAADILAMEKRLRHKDGHWIWGRVTVTLVRDAKAVPSHFIGVLEDITERRLALAALKDSEIRYRSILESAPDSITITRVADGRYMEVNPYFCAISGFSRQEALGSTPQDLNIFADPEGRQRLVAELETKGEVNAMEIRYRRKNGSLLDALLSARRLRFAGEDCLVAVATDITEQKRVALALARSEERFRQLAEMMPETIFETDSEGGLTFVNRHAFSTFGYSAEDLALGQNALDMIAPEDRHRAAQNLTRIAAGEDMRLNEYTALRKDGARFPVMIRSTPIRDEGRLLGLRGFIIDLTEKKKMEDQIRQSQKMEAIGTLAGGIAHDFNNILSAILGYADLSLAEETPGSRVHGHLLKIGKAGERARDLVRQILTFSRKTDQEMVPVQIRAIVAEALKLIRSTLPATIEIRSRLASTAMAMADPTHIHQVLMNLCTNAGHAMALTGGTLSVSLDDVAIPRGSGTDLGPGPYVRLIVADTGHGMSQSVMTRMFDPFFTTKGPDQGTGLGLAVVHGIVNRHGGAIDVSSVPGQGATFTVHIPALAGDTGTAPATTAAPPTGSGTILLIDDEDFQVDLGGQMLRKLGYTVECATRAEKGLDLFMASPQRFDLVITDMTMPQMTGAALARRILDIRPDMPVILCTGYSEQITEAEALAMGIRAFALKPLNFHDLAHLVHRVLTAAP